MSGPICHAILSRHPRVIRSGEIWRHVFIGGSFWVTIAVLHLKSQALWSDVLIGLFFSAFTFRAFATMHECVHSALTKRKSLNSGCGFVCGVFCFLPFSGWRSMHLEHHRWTGCLDRDPTTRILLQFEKAGYVMPRGVSWAWRLWVPLLGLLQHVVFWRATLNGRELRFFAGVFGYLGVALVLAGPIGLMCGILSYLALVEAVNLPHHLGMKQARGLVKFSFAEQNRFTRSCIYPKWIAHLVLLNFNLHTAHHLFPSHPWYQLDALHKELCDSGLQLNIGSANDWTWQKRRLPLNRVLLETFVESDANIGVSEATQSKEAS